MLQLSTFVTRFNTAEYCNHNAYRFFRYFQQPKMTEKYFLFVLTVMLAIVTPCGLVSYLIHHYTRKYFPVNHQKWAYTITALIYPTVFLLTYFLEKIPIWLFMHEETTDFRILSFYEKGIISSVFILIGVIFQVYFIYNDTTPAETSVGEGKV